MSDLPTPDWFNVRNRGALKALQSVVARKKRGYEVNTYAGPRIDKSGKTIFTLGYDDKPDSDWGRYSGHKMIVRLLDNDLAGDVENTIRRGLGWPPAEHLDEGAAS